VKTKVIALKVNNNKYDLEVQIISTLADVLREQLGLTGTKIMCNEGECGACTVLINGKPFLSCMTLAVDCENKNILTIEGMADAATGNLHPIQQAFVAKSGMQCGVCTPGMILTTRALLEENPTPTEIEVRKALSGNLCRCGNYQRITECVLDAAEMLRKEAANG
jgi:aerobic carbon-monoxide dehydrogenase small subunit